ncbi:MAG: DUF4159 domain-containing protein [Vicinamibacterales bacterium]
MRARPLTVAGVLACFVAFSATALAQRGWGRIPEGYGVPIQRMRADHSDGNLAICKLAYRSVRSEWLGMGWATDYPYAAMNLMTRVSELTKTPISRNEEGEPNHFVVSALDPALFRCPYVMAADVGTLHFSDAEVARMREYLLKGGFLWVDDFWGTRAWQQWSSEIKRVLPEFPIFDIPLDHPIRHTLYDLQSIPQVTAIQNWRGSGFSTSERGDDSPHANFRGIADAHGRIVVVMTHNTDIADSWEREGEDREYFLQFSPQGYSVGINVVLYALTH